MLPGGARSVLSHVNLQGAERCPCQAGWGSAGWHGSPFPDASSSGHLKLLGTARRRLPALEPRAVLAHAHTCGRFAVPRTPRAPRHAESLKPSQRSPRALAASAGPVRPDMLKQLLMFINPSLQPKTAITSSVGIQVSSLPGGNRQISTRGLPYPLGSGAAGSRIYVHQCCGFQVSKAEGQCDVKNIGFALPSTAEPWPMVLGMEKKNLLQYHGVHLGGICGLRCSGSGPRHGLCRERSPHGEGAGIFLRGWSGCAAWVQGVLGEVGEAPLSRPAVLSSSCSDDLNNREGEGRLKCKMPRYSCSGTAADPASLEPGPPRAANICRAFSQPCAQCFTLFLLLPPHNAGMWEPALQKRKLRL